MSLRSLSTDARDPGSERRGVSGGLCARAPSACSTLMREVRSVGAGRSGSPRRETARSRASSRRHESRERRSSRRCRDGSAAGEDTGRAPGDDTGRAGGAGNAGCVTDDVRAPGAGGALSPEGRSFDPPSPSPVRTSEKMSSAESRGAPGSLAPGGGPDSCMGRCPSAIATSAWKTSSVKGFSRMLDAPTRCASARLLRPL